jgi:dUTP pyrophosphatase
MFQETKYLLNVKFVDPEFTYDFVTHHEGDSGIDLFSSTDILEIEPFSVRTIDFKIQCEMIDLTTNQFTSYYLVPRSSLSSTTLQLCNSIGIIDASYRGNLKAKVRNVSNTYTTLQYGKYFQIVAPDLKPIRVQVVDTLSTTTRGDGGFGSTN